LFITAALETRQAQVVRSNRKRKADDDDTIEEWEQLEGECDFEQDGWAKRVEETKPNVEVDGAIVETRKLREEVKELRRLLEEVLKKDRSSSDKATE
jgi:hypothetical protein